jgi:membrane protease subunit (stomatin/prohibitin family)
MKAKLPPRPVKSAQDYGTGICPHCGDMVPLREEGTIKTHDFPKPCRSVCPGTGQRPTGKGHQQQ